jgi:predicted nucleotidyltransferase component of viral defense system
MDLEKIRRTVIIAMFSDDELAQILVLKGGNALAIVHALAARASIDVDLSIPDTFNDEEDVKQRLFRALRERFDAGGYVVFDESFTFVPERTDVPAWWGGYEITFKIIERTLYQNLDLSGQRRQSLPIDTKQSKTFRIEISRNEYCDSKEQRELDGFTVYVNPLAVLALEKLRALCQQMPEYLQRTNKTARARDFYDICTILDQGIDLASPDNLKLCRRIFALKQVPLNLLPRILHHREFHRLDWPAVEASVSHPVQSFDHYFDRVVAQISRLNTLWVE